MFAILTVKAPHSKEVTRLVFGCIEPAEQVGNLLLSCGYSIEPETCPIAPLRDEDEVKRSQQLCHLAMMPTQGNA